MNLFDIDSGGMLGGGLAVLHRVFFCRRKCNEEKRTELVAELWALVEGKGKRAR